MQKIIDRILEGNFDYGNGSLDFSCDKMELSIQKGQLYEGSFRIFAPAGQFTEGGVFSSDWRMECLTGEFAGAEEEVFFRFHGETLEEGEVVKGCFDIISNQGEYYLPFVVSVGHGLPESSTGTIKNLFHFANLAQSNWEEAVKIFYSPGFAKIFSGSDAQFAEGYRALSDGKEREQAVEEFLIWTNKKQKVEFFPESESLSLTAGEDGVTEAELYIVRSGWGFTQLYVECRGDFLFTEKECLTDDDFLGNRGRLPVFVDNSLCHRGRNFGQIRLYNCYVDLTVSVTVGRDERGAAYCRDTDKKRYTLQLMEYYQAFRLRKISTSTWLRETDKLVEKIVGQDPEDISARLFQAQVLITEERYHEAGWILDYVSERLEAGEGGDTLLAYYFYLTTLIHGDADTIVRMTGKVEHIYRQDRSNWRVAWLLLYLSEDLQGFDKARWDFLEELFATGCTSPVLYMETLSLLNANPALLRKLGRFEQQVVYYGMTQGILKREVAEQVVFLAGRAKEYSRILFLILEGLYEKKKDLQVLSEICTLLIKGGKAGEAYFDWYKAGVDAQLRITNLYEYYMMSIDIGKFQELPKTVLMYFSYQNNLDYARTAYLYDYVWQRWDKLGDIYDAYRGRMEHFAVDQIKKGHINRHLAQLYDRLLQPGMLDEQTGEAFSRLLFTHLVRTEDERMRKVYVYQPGNVSPGEYALSDGSVLAPVYGGGTVVFEDGQKNRFIKSVGFSLERMMAPGKYVRWLMPLVSQNPGFDLYLCVGEGASKEEAGDIKRLLRVAESDYAEASVKRGLYLRILQYFYETDDVRALDNYLTRIPAGELGAKERGEVIRYMVLRGSYELAGEWLDAYGPYFIDPKVLVRLVGILMERCNMTRREVLTAAAVYVFRRGKYDSTILDYLGRYYMGMTRNMRDIWKAARSFDTDCYRLSERILVQMLYSGAFVGEKMEIFRYYLSQGAKLEVEEAFLAQCSYDYFVRERVMEPELFREIRNMYLRGEPVQKVCKLAFLKYAAESREQEEEAADLTEVFLKEMMDEEIHLEFFRKFKQCRFVQQELADKTIVEYRTSPGAKVCIHYMLLHEDGETGGYRAEYMREAYGGVFFREYVLFFGETLQYYITEERDGEERLTESGALQGSDDYGNGEEGRYRLINDIVICMVMEDFETMDNLVEEYYKKDFLGGRLFELK